MPISLPKLFIALTVTAQIFAGSIFIPAADPLHQFYRHQYRLTHDLATPLFPIPHSLIPDTIPYSLFPIPSKDAYIRLLPQLHLNNRIPNHQFRLWSSTKWNNFSMFIEFLAVNENYGVSHVSSDYSRGGVSGRVLNSFIDYSTDAVSLRFGRSPVFWGQSWEASIIQSGYYPSYENITASVHLGNFKYEILAGQLSSEHVDDTRIRRNIAGHRINWGLGNGKLVLGVGEQIIYTGENRPVELFYLNPVVPYFFTALEGDETGTPDNDNSIIIAYGRYVHKPNLSAYFELVIDDFQVDENTTPHATGFKFGVDGGTQIKGREISFEAEYTRVGSWTYIHHGQYTSWQNRRHPIGYRYGPDCQSFMALADYWLQPGKLMLSAKYTYLEKGSNNLNTVWASPGTKGDPFPTSPVTRHSLLVTSLKYFHKFGLLEAGWSNYPVGNAEIDGIIKEPKGSFFLKAQLVWGFGYDLD